MSFARLIENTLTALGAKIPPLVYLAQHAGRILSMSGDGRADLVADDEEIDGKSGLAKLVVLVGLPGVRLDIEAGDRVRFGAEGGSPAGQEARAFEQDRNADRPLGRKGDRVKLGTLTIGNIPPPAPPSSGLVITWIAEPSPFNPVPGLPQIATITGPVAIAPDPFSLALEGWIVTGSPEISIRKTTSENIP